LTAYNWEGAKQPIILGIIGLFLLIFLYIHTFEDSNQLLESMPFIGGLLLWFWMIPGSFPYGEYVQGIILIEAVWFYALDMISFMINSLFRANISIRGTIERIGQLIVVGLKKSGR